jgi:diadenylate cyclase
LTRAALPRYNKGVSFFQQLSGVYNILRHIFDVLILAFLIYKAWELLVKTRATALVTGAGILVLFYGFAYLLNLETLTWLFNMMAPGLVVAVAIVFQPELRKMIQQLGVGEWFRPDARPQLSALESVITAAEILSSEKRGALIVFPRRTNIKQITTNGTRLNAEISSSLIVTVFEFDTPLHDGAMLIQNGKISYAGCFLPVSEQTNIKKSFGTRHRAALGLSEQSDAVILIVSEETGAISIAYESQIYYDLSSDEILKKLRGLLEKGIKRGEFVPGQEAAAPATDVGDDKAPAEAGAPPAKTKEAGK